MFHPWAPGAAFWLGKGTTLYNTLANYMRGVLFPAGYEEVKSAASSSTRRCGKRPATGRTTARTCSS